MSRGNERVERTPERWLVGVTEYAGLTDYIGGIGRHYASLLPALVRAGAEVDLVVFFDGERMHDSPTLDGVRILGYHRLPRVPRLLKPLVRAAIFALVYRRGRYTRVFAPEWAAVGALLPRRAPLLTNLATSTRVANRVAGLRIRSFGLRGGAAVLTQSVLEDRQIRRSRGVVPISRAMLAANERELGALPPAMVVRNCIDVAAVQAAAGRAAPPAGWPELAATDRVVLFLGRLERRKGVLAAVAAFARVADREPGVRLVLAGASGDARFEPTRQQLLALVPASARGRVVFLGHVAGDELYRAIADADVVLCPSLWEGFGQVALEVRAIGTPSVVSTGSGYDDFCHDGVDCLMVPPGDAEALAAATVRLLADRALADRLASAALETIEEFTADAVAPELRRAAAELLGDA